MRRIEVIEGPLRGEPPKKIVDALVVDDAFYEFHERLRTALEIIRDADAEVTPEDLRGLARAALDWPQSRPLTAYEWDALRNANGA